VPRWPKITQQRKPKSVRLTEIRQCIASGIHDPREIAERLGVSANLICRYANADNSIEVHPIRRGNRIGIRLHIKP
jgi:transcriptional regulator with XRE-family HTH domain